MSYFYIDGDQFIFKETPLNGRFLSLFSIEAPIPSFGTGAVGYARIDDAGSLTGVTTSNFGSNYRFEYPPKVSINAEEGTGASATALVNGIKSVSLLDGGYGYSDSNPPLVDVQEPTKPGSTTATIKATVTNGAVSGLEIVNSGSELAIVIGGGNIFRGVSGASNGIDRVQADYMGMLATVINGLALQSSLEELNVQTRLQTAVKIEAVAEPYIKRKAVRHLEKKRVVIFSAGTGNPFFTTDSAAVLRAIEINADAILKGTRVDGIYNIDPEKNKDAVKFKKLTYDEAINKKLKIMDSTAFTLSQENNLPIIVFNMNKPGNLKKITKNHQNHQQYPPLNSL